VADGPGEGNVHSHQRVRTHAGKGSTFFGKGIWALGWTVISDSAPREIAGLSGGLFNRFGNISSITTPIIIGFIIQTTGSFDWALIFIGANAFVAVVSYLVIVGEIKRLQLTMIPS
jgi:ACS family glucarate transporter-like MFS transporter